MGKAKTFGSHSFSRSEAAIFMQHQLYVHTNTSDFSVKTVIYLVKSKDGFLWMPPPRGEGRSWAQQREVRGRPVFPATEAEHDQPELGRQHDQDRGRPHCLTAEIDITSGLIKRAQLAKKVDNNVSGDHHVGRYGGLLIVGAGVRVLLIITRVLLIITSMSHGVWLGRHGA